MSCILLAAYWASGCTNSGDRDGGARQFTDGESVFISPVEGGNSFTCNSCHALTEPSSDGLRRAGHALENAPARASFKNGQVETFLEAVNSCLDEWMGVSEPWTDDTADFQLLRELLLVEGAEAEELSFEIVPPPPLEDLMEGDAEAGRVLFNQSCSVCHGVNGVGTNRAPVVTGFGVELELVAERIRLSGQANSEVYDGLTGGRMPFWAADRLADDEVADLAMYLSTSESDESSPGVFIPEDPPPGLPPVVNCAATHQRVGDSLTFRRFNHDVGGTVTVIDDCTLRVEDFDFDGRGVNVQLYGALDRNYEDGFSMSADLRRDTAYDGATFEINLPEGVTLDDFDSVSVWCVPVGQNFGDGVF